ncbi:hypothetical protein FB451DRAFT_1401600 [Mycena latifolia]|nr:hypothetical protein FB451DRAFT_1401600 [Mycena latifolia]
MSASVSELHPESLHGPLSTFWHSQLLSWLPSGVTVADLVTNVIRQHVQQESQGMGANVTSWEVMNEIAGDGVSNGMTAPQCVKNKNDWPMKTADGSGTNLVTDLLFVHTTFSTALQFASASMRLALNDYYTGGNNSKIACMFAVLADINANAGIPYHRLAVDFQSHVSDCSNETVDTCSPTVHTKRLSLNCAENAVGPAVVITQRP